MLCYLNQFALCLEWDLFLTSDLSYLNNHFFLSNFFIFMSNKYVQTICTNNKKTVLPGFSTKYFLISKTVRIHYRIFRAFIKRCFCSRAR
jgi:hypothetical protein